MTSTLIDRATGRLERASGQVRRRCPEPELAMRAKERPRRLESTDEALAIGGNSFWHAVALKQFVQRD